MIAILSWPEVASVNAMENPMVAMVPNNLRAIRHGSSTIDLAVVSTSDNMVERLANLEEAAT